MNTLLEATESTARSVADLVTDAWDRLDLPIAHSAASRRRDHTRVGAALAVTIVAFVVVVLSRRHRLRDCRGHGVVEPALV